ncbi:MAG TPA: transcriptional regulator [Clostridiales bacterium]|nr:MAG: transcriptional regulator [Clostridiales bacterium GWD2_32_59]HAN10113.1 transcriptional regulator [Clostridiales bacterium]
MKVYDFNGKKNICGSKIRESRKNKKLTQQQLAAKLELMGITIDRVTITKIENGERICLDFELMGIAQILGISSDYLLGLHT